MTNPDDKDLSRFILNYLEGVPHFHLLESEDKAQVYKLYHSIMDALYYVLIYPNVYPLIVVKDLDSLEVIDTCLENLADTIPSLERVKVRVVH
tara:strand:- start:2256 stop:2534 length:279 start_codon:yes stop_codon:yes gene_type:complete